MKLLSGIITLSLAIVISAVAAYFSVVGLAALFSAAFLPVVIMGSVLEAGKLAAAHWLHGNWRNPRVGWFHRGYLLTAIFALMVITSIGIYGFLSKGHLEQEVPVAGINLQISLKEQQIESLTKQNQRLYERIQQLDDSIAVYLNHDMATAGLKAREGQREERSEVESQIGENINLISQLQSEILPLRIETQTVDAKLGPVKYLAELFGWDDPEVAVRMVILILMLAFDPLAIVLLLSSAITFADWSNNRQPKTKVVGIQDEIITESIDDKTEAVIDQEEERETFIRILEKRPELLEQMIDIIAESNKKNESSETAKPKKNKDDKVTSWLKQPEKK